MIELTYTKYCETYTFRMRNSKECEVSCTCDEESELDEHGTFYRTENNQWVLVSIGRPISIIKKSEIIDEMKVPSSNKDDWDRVIGPWDDTVFLDYLRKCYTHGK